MHRGLSHIAVVIALSVGAFNAATVSLVPAQGTAGTADSEREYRQATWALLNSMKDRQVRQDRILGFGFGTTLALLIGLGIVILNRTSSGALIRPSLAPSESGRTKERLGELGRAWIQQLAKLRLDAHHASFVRRQKRIRNLLSEIQSHMVTDFETNQRFRQALENLVRETERLEADFPVCAQRPNGPAVMMPSPER